MKLFHVSMDLNIGEVEFVPRVPAYRCKGEDNKTKRICVCPSLESAISAFPYKSYFINKLMQRKKDSYLAIYTTETDKFLNCKEIADRVPDAHLTNEHWILEPFKAKAEIIKIKKLTLTGFNKYINEYYGQVKELEYESDLVDFDREEEFILLSNKMLNKFSKIAKKNNLGIEILEDKLIHLEHIYGVRTTKRYRWIKVKVFIPSGVSVAPLWLLNDKQNEFALRKKITFREGKRTREDVAKYYCSDDFDYFDDFDE